MPTPFDVVPDPTSRAAMNEIMEPGAFKFVRSDDEYTPPEGVDDPDMFPPEPAHFLLINAAYLREGAPFGIKQELAILHDEFPPTAHAVGLYRGAVDLRIAKMSGLVNFNRDLGVEGLAKVYDIKRFCIDAVRRQGTNMLAAHIIARTRDSGALVEALALPTVVSEGIPLRIREAMVPFVGSVPPDHPNQEWIRLVMQGSTEAREPAAIAAASFLPKSPVFKAALLHARQLRARDEAAELDLMGRIARLGDPQIPPGGKKRKKK